MSDWKRFAVWIGVIAWCFFSLAFDVRAANTIIIKKKAVASVPAGGGGETKYFGYCNADGSNKAASEDRWSTLWIRNKNYVTGFTTAAGGSCTVTGLHAWVHSISEGSTPGNIRLAIYDSSDNLICQGNAEVSVTNASSAWIGHTTFTGTTTLAASTTYYIGYTQDNIDTVYTFDTGTSGDSSGSVESTEYTSGWPASLADGSDWDTIVAVRCTYTQ